jgi:hypothetical protein
LLATARSGGNATKHDVPVGDAEMAAILGVLRGDEDEVNGNGQTGPDEPAGAVEESPSVVEQPPTAAG